MHRMTFRLAIVSILACGLLFTGCNSTPQRSLVTPPDAKSTAEQGPLVVLGSDADESLKILVAAFQAKFPDVLVKLEPGVMSAQGAEQAKELLASGKVDVVTIGTPATPLRDLAGAGLLEPLGPYLGTGGLDTAKFGGALEQTEMEGNVYQLPVRAVPYFVVYNIRLFEQGQAALPRKGWTWDEFRTAARALTDAGAGRWGVWADNPEVFAQAWLGQHSPKNPWSNEEQLRAGLGFLGGLTNTDRSMAPPGAQGSSYTVQFGQGSAAMALATPGSFAYLRSMAKFPWGVAPLPTAEGRPALTPTLVLGMGVSANSPNKDAAWAFIKFCAGEDGALALTRAGHFPVYRSPDVRQAWTEPMPGAQELFDTDWLVLNPPGKGDQLMLEAQGRLVRKALGSDGGDLDSLLFEYRRETAGL